MEIEYDKDFSPTLPEDDEQGWKTPEKKTNASSHYLSLTPKCKIYLASKEGIKNVKIARELGCDPKTVKKIVSKAKTKKTLDNQHSTKGRYPKGSSVLTERHKTFLLDWINEGKYSSTNEMWLHLCDIKTLKHVSYDTVNRYIKSIGKWVKPKLKRVNSQKNFIKRRNYCLAEKNVILHQDILYTDETMFELNRNTTRVFKFKRESMPEIEKLSTWVRQMIWAGISWYGKTEIQFIDGWINNKRYVELLKKARKSILDLFPREFYFLQDNARPHSHKHSIRYIKRWITKNIKDHPPQSPDLNPIEIVWGTLKNMVEKRRPKDKKELRTAILECWEEIPMSFVRNCILGLPSKMDKALKNANDKIQEEFEDNINQEEFAEEDSYDSFGDEFDSEDISDEEIDDSDEEFIL